jgi:hypothetical protein
MTHRAPEPVAILVAGIPVVIMLKPLSDFVKSIGIFFHYGQDVSCIERPCNTALKSSY